MREQVLKKFGRYFLLDQIAQGGMAEIYRARLTTPDGAGRLLVIKRIQAGYGSNNEFRQMFKSEIKVTMGFNHPNIVQLYDYGEEMDQPYIAMEYVDGMNARELLNRSKKRARAFPNELVAYIIEQVASGLYYAHSFRDKITGQPLNIVHRDISPQNIIISYDGNIKIIDFGIAKATTNVEATSAGIIKGKPSYLSPEQIRGKELDGRSDIFALGAVFWELLVGRKLFSAPEGENEYSVLKQIENCESHVKVPSTFNSNVSKELDQIVMKCLTKNENSRFKDALELQKAIKTYLAANAPAFSQSDVAQCVRDLFAEELVEDRKVLQALSAKAEQLLASAAQIETLGAGRSRSSKFSLDNTNTVRDANLRVRKPGGIAKEFEVKEDTSQVKIVAPEISQDEPPRRRVMSSTAETSGPILRESAPEEEADSGKLKWLVPAVAVVVAVVLGSRFLKMFNSPQSISARSVAQKPAEVKKSSIVLRLSLFPNWGNASVTLNGHNIEARNPAVTAPLDVSLDLDIRRPGFKAYRKSFVLSKDEVGGIDEKVMEVRLEPEKYGILSISTVPSADIVMVDVDQGRGVASEQSPIVLSSPIEDEKFPVGTYQVRLKNDVLGMEKNLTIEIPENQTVKIREKLELR